MLNVNEYIVVILAISIVVHMFKGSQNYSESLVSYLWITERMPSPKAAINHFRSPESIPPSPSEKLP